MVAGSGTASGGVFTAGQEGAEYLLASQTRVKLAPGTSVRLFPVAQPLELSPGVKTPTWSFALMRGRVDVSVPGNLKNALMVSIGKLSVVVTRGGAATILAHGHGSTVANTAGEVRTLLGERWQTLPVGMVARFNNNNLNGTPQPAIDPPTLSGGQRLWFSAGGATRIQGLDVGSVAGAAAYELRLRRKDDRGEQVQRLSGTARGEQLSLPEPGEYKVSARSVDGEGLPGGWSKEQPLRVLGVILPEDASLAGNTVQVGPGQELRFTHTDGLEMSYKGAGGYVPASRAVTLHRDELTIVSFRVPGSLDATMLRLLPRKLRADVTIGPKHAVWPNDMVQIVVNVSSEHRTGALPEKLELKPEVTLGVQRLDLAFKREGNRWTANVPAPHSGGPWVLRVEVKDQFGASLGREFLEIARATGAESKVAGK